MRPIQDLDFPETNQNLDVNNNPNLTLQSNQKEDNHELSINQKSVEEELKPSRSENPRISSFGDIENKLKYSHSSINSTAAKPIDFYVIAPEDGDGYNLMYTISEMMKRPNLDWKRCKVASEDLRVIQQLGSCRECSEGRPLAIFMPCGHGGSCLRCSIQKSSKQKLCHYCDRVNLE